MAAHEGTAEQRDVKQAVNGLHDTSGDDYEQIYQKRVTATTKKSCKGEQILKEITKTEVPKKKKPSSEHH